MNMTNCIKELIDEAYCRTEYENGAVHECYEFSAGELTAFVELIAFEAAKAALEKASQKTVDFAE